MLLFIRYGWMQGSWAVFDGGKISKLPSSGRRAAAYFGQRVNSMSDLFHHDVPVAYIMKVFDVMHRAFWRQYQLLTKRSERLLDLNPVLDWRRQIWMGVSIETEDYLFRADHLRKTGAHIKFLSIEPLLGATLQARSSRDRLGHSRRRIGSRRAPSGCGMGSRNSRPLHSCRCALLFQTMGWSLQIEDRELDGRTWDEMPVQVNAPTTDPAAKRAQPIVLT